ncbi:hypothetical protein L1D94_19640, partial [Vibrio alginolyticus]|uniref:hypothetical protein n=1 Tax=Vibrio alginolyticus TaxID=663 RepID=UPI001EFE05D0
FHKVTHNSLRILSLKKARTCKMCTLKNQPLAEMKLLYFTTPASPSFKTQSISKEHSLGESKSTVKVDCMINPFPTFMTKWLKLNTDVSRCFLQSNSPPQSLTF